MRKKLNKFYWSYIIASVVVIIVLAVFEATGFQMQGSFKKDLRISLPDYTVEKIEKYDVCDSNDELIHAVKEYYIQFYDPLPVTSVNIVTEEKRGWHSDGQGGYYLNRNKGGEELFCYLNIEDNRAQIKYHYAYLLSGLPIFTAFFAMFLGVLFIILLTILELTLGNRKKQSHE